MWRRLAVAATAAALMPLASAALTDREAPAGEAPATATEYRSSPRERAFADSSPFNTPIEPGVALDPRSAEIVDLLSSAGHATAAVYRYVPPVYDADAETPRYDMVCIETWGPCDFESVKVPIPDNAIASPGSDASLVVIDWSTERVFEFWKYREDRRTVAWGSVLPLTGSGTGSGTNDPGRFGATGAGVSRLAGVVRTHEITEGHIDHALVGVTGRACRGAFRYPAVKTDGWAAGDRCIPQGARVQLDPRVHCRSLPHIKAWEVAVCEALQTYGWYNIDNGARRAPGFTIQFENPHGGHDPYPGVGLEEYARIDAIPLDRLRVLATWSTSG